MTIGYLGYDYYQSSSLTASDTMTVPAGTDFVALIFTGYKSGGDLWPLVSGTFGGKSLVAQTGANYNGTGDEFIGVGGISGHVAIYTATGSFSTSEDLDYELGGGVLEGVGIIAMFFSGVDQTTPVVEAETQASKDTNISGLTYVPGSYTVGGAYAYTQAPACSGSGQTQVTNGVYNSAGHCAGYKAHSTSFNVTNTNFTRVAAIVINAAVKQDNIKPTIVTKPWTKQPPVDTKIDWTNPITKNLQAVFRLMNNHEFSVGKERVPLAFYRTNGSIDQASNTRGRCLEKQKSGTDPNRHILVPTSGRFSASAKSFSAFMWVRKDGSSSTVTHDIAGQWDFASGNKLWILTGPHGSTHRARIEIILSSDATLSVADAGPDVDVGGWHFIGATWNQDLPETSHELKLYVDGVEIGSNTSTSVIKTVGQEFSIFGQEDGTNPYDGFGQDFMFWDRPLRPAEVESLYLDTWQIFQPQKIAIPAGPASTRRLVTF